MLKTLILNPPQFIPINYRREVSGVRNDDVLSIGYLAAYAESRGHNIRVVDMYTWSWERVADFIAELHPEHE